MNTQTQPEIDAILAHAVASFRHLFPRQTRSIKTHQLAREIRKIYDSENVHVACVLNNLAAVPSKVLFLA